MRGDSLANVSEYLANELRRTPNVTVRLGVEVVDGEGDGHLEAVTLRHRAGGELERLPTSALFVHIGAEPGTEWLQGSVARDRPGYVLTGADLLRGGSPGSGWPLSRPPLMFETSLPGVFAAGDIRHGSVKRVASAVGEGATAVQLVHQYLAEQKGALASAFVETAT